MFVNTKDGKKIGVSLKKDFKVFIVNGGFDKKIKESTAELEKSIKNYKPLPTGSRRTPKQEQAYENMKKKIMNI